MDSVNRNIEIYGKAFDTYGDDSRSCLWSKPMIPRYQELVKIAPLENASVLEIGCGIGGVYEYMVKDCRINNLTYKGVDLVEGMVELAKEKYPKAHFEVRNILENPIEEQYDYVFFCGTFNFAMDEEFMKKMLKEGFSYCKKGMAFNFVSTYVNFRNDEEEAAYYKPQDIFTFCVENLSKKVQMNHHYMKCDTSVFVYR